VATISAVVIAFTLGYALGFLAPTAESNEDQQGDPPVVNPKNTLGA